MKRLGCIAIGLFLFSSAVAQDGRETMVGLNVNYVGGGKVRSADGTSINLGYTWKASLTAGHYIFNNVALGIGGGYEYMSDHSGKQYTYEIAPYIRYYAGSYFGFFLHLDAGKGWGNSRFDNGERNTHEVFFSTLRPGLYSRIGEHVMLELRLSTLEYKDVKITDKVGNDSFSKSSWDFRFDFNFGVGIIFEFGYSKK